MKCLESATFSIDILSPNVIDTCIWNLLTQKLLSVENFHVRIITNDRHNHSQSYSELHSNEKTYFCKKQKQLKNLSIRFSNGNDAENVKHYLETDEKNWPILIDHSKYFNVDLQHFYIGSFNMDAISLHASGESGIIIENDSDMAKEVNEFVFEYCWNKAKEFLCA
jgi:phosphatidylserine/phosphatidylglycerophosphate/cardiolipin synthase-like enzyme